MEARAVSPREFPVLRTRRLLLRALAVDDIPDLAPLIGAREVAENTLRIVHPYTEQDARQYLEFLRTLLEKGEGVRLGIFVAEGEKLCGGVGLQRNLPHSHAELGYWIGVPFWGKGYASEAAQALLEYGFKQLQLHRIFASVFPRNAASIRILEKLGMTYEGTMRQHYCKWGEYLDSALYGILKTEYEAQEQL